MDAPHRLGDAVARRDRRRLRERLDAVERAHDGPPPAAVLEAVQATAAERALAAARLFDHMACRAVRALAAHRRRMADPDRAAQLAALGRDLADCRAGGLGRLAAAVQADRSPPACTRSISATVSATP